MRLVLGAVAAIALPALVFSAGCSSDRGDIPATRAPAASRAAPGVVVPALPFVDQDGRVTSAGGHLAAGRRERAAVFAVARDFFLRHLR